MSEQENSLELAVNNLATEMRRANYLHGLLGTSGNTKRPHLYNEFGYPKNLTFNDFYNMYRRNAVAFAAVHRLLDGCWIDNPVIVEGGEENEARKETAWEKQVKKLLKKHWKKVRGADRRNMIGRYSGLLIQLRDGLTWDQPVSGSKTTLVKLIPVAVFEQQPEVE